MTDDKIDVDSILGDVFGDVTEPAEEPNSNSDITPEEESTDTISDTPDEKEPEKPDKKPKQIRNKGKLAPKLPKEKSKRSQAKIEGMSLDSFLGTDEEEDESESSSETKKKPEKSTPKEKSEPKTDVDFDILNTDKEETIPQEEKVKKPKATPPKKSKVKSEDKVKPTAPDSSVKSRIDAVMSNNGDFDLSLSKHHSKITAVVFGDKGTGKTSSVLSGKLFKGSISAISLDHMTEPIADELFPDRDDIFVYDGLRYYEETDKKMMLLSAHITVDYLNSILDKIAENPTDWIMWDCSEKLQNICEMRMRRENNLGAFSGISNPNVWKERGMYMDSFFRRSFEIAKKGVIFTLYRGYKEIIRDGAVINTQSLPKWCGNLMTQTLVVLRTERKTSKRGGTKYYLVAESSKLPSFIETDEWVDVTAE